MVRKKQNKTQTLKIAGKKCDKLKELSWAKRMKYTLRSQVKLIIIIPRKKVLKMICQKMVLEVQKIKNKEKKNNTMIPM